MSLLAGNVRVFSPEKNASENILRVRVRDSSLQFSGSQRATQKDPSATGYFLRGCMTCVLLVRPLSCPFVLNILVLKVRFFVHGPKKVFKDSLVDRTRYPGYPGAYPSQPVWVFFCESGLHSTVTGQ